MKEITAGNYVQFKLTKELNEIFDSWLAVKENELQTIRPFSSIFFPWKTDEFGGRFVCLSRGEVRRARKQRNAIWDEMLRTKRRRESLEEGKIPERKTDVDAARRYRKQVHHDGQMFHSPLLLWKNVWKEHEPPDETSVARYSAARFLAWLFRQMKLCIRNNARSKYSRRIISSSVLFLLNDPKIRFYNNIGVERTFLVNEISHKPEWTQRKAEEDATKIQRWFLS